MDAFTQHKKIEEDFCGEMIELIDTYKDGMKEWFYLAVCDMLKDRYECAGNNGNLYESVEEIKRLFIEVMTEKKRIHMGDELDEAWSGGMWMEEGDEIETAGGGGYDYDDWREE